jgi:hypothetical protein
MADGDRTGLGVLRDQSAWIGVEREGNSFNIVMVQDVSMNKDWTTKSTGSVAGRRDNVSFRKVYLRANADIRPGQAGSATFSYSTDGNSWTSLGSRMTLGTYWEFFPGNRWSIHNFATKKLGGSVKVERFDNR